MKLQTKRGKIKLIITITIVIVWLILIIFAEDIIKFKNKNKVELLENTAQAGYTTAIGDNTYDITNAVAENANPPTITAGMIPVKWDGTYWIITTKNDTELYDYNQNKPAYIMLNDGTYQSELLQDMTNKKLAEENIGAQIAESELGSIYMWLPRFAYNEQGEIIYIKQGYSVAGSWTTPEMFTYQTEKMDFSLAGVWVEYNTLSSTSEVTIKIKNMIREDSQYEFIANIKPIAMVATDLTAIEKYIVGVGVHDDPITDTNNLKRTILKVTNSSQPEPIKARAYYDNAEEKIKIEVIYNKNEITKILDKNGNILSENSIIANTGDELIGNGIYRYIIIDNLGNQKMIKTTVTGLNIYTISNEEELKLFRDAVNNNKTNASTIANQVADIKMNVGNYRIDETTGDVVFNTEKAEKWESIGTYTGKYYGNYHTISGIYGYSGLFSLCNGAKIQGVGIIESYIKLSGNGGALLRYAQGNTIIENCYSEATIETAGDRVGGIVGQTYNSSSAVQLTINNCYNKGKITIKSGYNFIGGIVGYGYNANIKNCYNIGEILYNGTSTSKNGGHIGGIVGYLPYGSLKNCYNIADISCYGENVGGIAGNVDSRKITIANCYNYGNITGYSIIGGITGGGSVTNSYNIGNITGKDDYVGGIAGVFDIDDGYTSSNLYNYGNVYTEGDNVGGIAGNLGWNNVTLQYVYNTGKVTGDKSVGGIAGNIGRAKIIYSYNIAEIIGRQNVGGIGGYLSGSVARYYYILCIYNK